MPSDLTYSPWLFAILASLATGLGGVLLAGLSLVLPERLLKKGLPLAISFATGSLLAAVFLDLLPEVSHALPGHLGFTSVLGGILLLHILERTLLWRHCHESHCGLHQSTRPFVLLGDGLHNFVDGLAIAAAFSASWAAGLAVTLAVLAHEIPQELGDFAILLKSGMSRGRALTWNALLSMSSLVGTVVGLTALGWANQLQPYALALSAASFLYIALGDLLPGHRTSSSVATFLSRLACMGAGIALIAWATAGHHH